MSAPIAHLVYARHYLDKHPQGDDAAFIAGSIFPDIRYLGGLERSVTHQPGKYSAIDVQNETDSWKAGTYYHNLVDDLWQAYIEKEAPAIAANAVSMEALKMLEDEYLYSNILDWLPIRVALRVVPNSEQQIAAPEICLKWHSIVNKLVVARPQRSRRESFLRELGFDDERLAELEQHVKELKINSRTPSLLQGLKSHIIEATVGRQY